MRQFSTYLLQLKLELPVSVLRLLNTEVPEFISISTVSSGLTTTFQRLLLYGK